MSARPVFALLHGGGQGSWVWQETAAALVAHGGKVLALDVPGCGSKRDRETITLSLDDVVEELIGDIKAAAFPKVVLVGHSQAGTLLPALWRRRPALFRRLVYLACCAPLPGQNVLDMMGYGLRGQNPDEVGWPLDPELHGKDIQRPLTLCNDMSPEQTRVFLANLDLDRWPLGVTYWSDWSYDGLREAPASYVVCRRDGILPPPWQRRFAERLSVQRILEIDAGHQAMNTQPEALAAMLWTEATGD